VKSVAEKLLIKPGTSVWLSVPERLPLLEPLPDGVEQSSRPADATTAVVFADDAALLQGLLERHGEALHSPSAVWVAYPKGGRTDLNRDSLWPLMAKHGMRPISQVAIDDVWSALRFRPLKEGEPPFTGGR
jgi:hypothetical protein